MPGRFRGKPATDERAEHWHDRLADDRDEAAGEEQDAHECGEDEQAQPAEHRPPPGDTVVGRISTE